MFEQQLSAIKRNTVLPTIFLGEIQGSEFITSEALSTLVGMSSVGNLTNANVPWLKYTYKGKTTYLAKKAIRHQMTWEQLDALGIVFGKEFTIAGKQHIVKIGVGWLTAPATLYDVSTGGDLNDLIYPIYDGVSKDYPLVMSYPKQAAYTDADLGLNTLYTQSGTNPGSLSWVQNKSQSGAYNMLRFYNDSDKAHQLTAGWGLAAGQTALYAGWRPIIVEV